MTFTSSTSGSSSSSLSSGFIRIHFEMFDSRGPCPGGLGVAFAFAFCFGFGVAFGFAAAGWFGGLPRAHVCFNFAFGLVQDMHPHAPSERAALPAPCRCCFCGRAPAAACSPPWGLFLGPLFFGGISISANALKQGLYTTRYDCNAKVARF